MKHGQRYSQQPAEGVARLSGLRGLNLWLLMLPVAAAAGVFGSMSTGWAHGVSVTYRTTQAIALEAAYDGGKPMAGAQVAVYAPDDPQTPWQRGVADAAGQFVFTPDPARPGTWEVQVRQAGHGSLVTIPVGESGAIASQSGGHNLSPLQKGVMAGSVIWGCVGTALFFSQRQKTRNAHP